MSVPDQGNGFTTDQNDSLCDFCNHRKALLYCRADSAKLCLNCDREVHSTNQLFKKHNRSLLCDSCNSSSSSIFCCTESAVLCQNCDWESHKNFGSIHDRRPLEMFSGCPSVTELLNFLGLEDLGKKSLVFGDGNEDGLLDLLVWETPSIVRLDDLIVSNSSTDSGHNFQAMGVPPLPKNRNAACGKQKQEIMCQLREMAETEPNFSGCLEDLVPAGGFQTAIPGMCEMRDRSPVLENNAEPMPVPSCETNAREWGNLIAEAADEEFPSTFFGGFIEANHLVPDKDSDVGDGSGPGNCCQELHPCVPIDSNTVQVPPKTATRELNSQERDSALIRYKEKRKTRRYSN